MPIDSSCSAAQVRALNDQFRRTLTGGRLVITAGVQALGPHRLLQLLRCVRIFEAFDQDNDPHGEHDFGAFTEGGDRFFWKIQYYDTKLEYGSEDPADPNQTVRVLTIMLADEY